MSRANNLRVELVTAERTGDLDDARRLFLEYAETLPFDLGYQNFDREMAQFPGDYAAPKGALYLARVDERAAGAIGVRPLGQLEGEIKRLYIRPDFRGLGLGRRLVRAVIDQGKIIGYRALRLDTVRNVMAEAEALYKSMGFREIAAYYESEVPNTAYYELALDEELPQEPGGSDG
jgi:ribosomal protein S18 acetylase RimI-like enzyme